jgi:hypothetical protein
MRVDKGLSVAVVVAVMDMKQRRGNQCKKHRAHRDQSAESLHEHGFSYTERM